MSDLFQELRAMFERYLSLVKETFRALPGGESRLPDPLPVSLIIENKLGGKLLRETVEELESREEFTLLVNALNSWQMQKSQDSLKELLEGIDPPDAFLPGKDQLRCFMRKSNLYLDLLSKGSTSITFNSFIQSFHAMKKDEATFLLSLDNLYPSHVDLSQELKFSIEVYDPKQMRELCRAFLYESFPTEPLLDYNRTPPLHLGWERLSKFHWLKKRLSRVELVQLFPVEFTKLPQFKNKPDWQEVHRPELVFRDEICLIQVARPHPVTFSNFILLDHSKFEDQTDFQIKRHTTELDEVWNLHYDQELCDQHRKMCSIDDSLRPHFKRLLEHLKGVLFSGQKKNGPLQRALDFFHRGSTETAPDFSFLFYVLTLEAILLKEKDHKLCKNFSTRLALLLGKGERQRKVLENLGRSIYETRSGFVHGNPQYSLRKLEEKLQEKAEKPCLHPLRELARRAILYTVVLAQDQTGKGQRSPGEKPERLHAFLDDNASNLAVLDTFHLKVEKYWNEYRSALQLEL